MLLAASKEKPLENQIDNTGVAKPAIKIAGGKSRMLEVITTNLPKDFDKVKYRYVEPFLGGGSVLLHFLQKYPWLRGQYSANDYNYHIANTWNTILSNTELLLITLESLSKDTSKKEFEQQKAEFNGTANSYLRHPNLITKAAQFIYLNKTCYNGLIRFNSKGEFNSPYGKYSNPKIFDKANILLVRKLLCGLVQNMDFQLYIEYLVKQKGINNKTFVYLDPPYIPTSLTASFTSYTPNNFGLYDQKRLALILELLNSKGAKFMMSNSDTVLTRKIFDGYNVKTIKNNRSISCKGSGRGKVNELLITNY